MASKLISVIGSPALLCTNWVISSGKFWDFQWHSAAPESLELDNLYWVYFFVHECARCMLDDVWWRLAVVWMIYNLSLETNLCSSDAQAHPGHIHRSDRQDAKREYMYGIQAALNRSPWFYIVWFEQCNLQENGGCRYIGCEPWDSDCLHCSGLLGCEKWYWILYEPVVWYSTLLRVEVLWSRMQDIFCWWNSESHCWPLA